MENQGDNNNAFVYMGGDQRVPLGVTHVTVHRSVDTIRWRAFRYCEHLLSIDIHDGVKIIEEEAFGGCIALKRIKLAGVKIIEDMAFEDSKALEDVEFGDQLERIGGSAFFRTSLRNIKLPKGKVIGDHAFSECKQLTDAVLSKNLQSIGWQAFYKCPRLKSIAIPLKIVTRGNNAFDNCPELSRVDLVGAGGIHKTISSLYLQSWRNEMNNEIDRINRLLSYTPAKYRTAAIQQWMRSVIRRIKHYKSEHYALLKKNMTQLELALWKVKLHEKEDDEFSLSSDLCALLKKSMTPLQLDRWKTKLDEEFAAARQAERITCGADIIIPHVLSFLNDDDVFPLHVAT